MAVSKMSDSSKAKPKRPAQPAERERGIFARLFGKPLDTPDREPDDWLYVDDSGFRIPTEVPLDPPSAEPDAADAEE